MFSGDFLCCTFGDQAMLWRELFEHQMPYRKRDVSAYGVGGGSSGVSNSGLGAALGEDCSGAG